MVTLELSSSSIKVRSGWHTLFKKTFKNTPSAEEISSALKFAHLLGEVKIVTK